MTKRGGGYYRPEELMSLLPGSTGALSVGTPGENMSEIERRVLVKLIDFLIEELSEAYIRTPISISSWVNVRKSYLIALSLKRLLGVKENG